LGKKLTVYDIIYLKLKGETVHIKEFKELEDQIVEYIPMISELILDETTIRYLMLGKIEGENGSVKDFRVIDFLFSLTKFNQHYFKSQQRNDKILRMNLDCYVEGLHPDEKIKRGYVMSIHLKIDLEEGSMKELRSNKFTLIIAEMISNKIFHISSLSVIREGKNKVSFPLDRRSQLLLRDTGKMEFLAFVANHYGEFSKSNGVQIVVEENELIP